MDAGADFVGEPQFGCGHGGTDRPWLICRRAGVTGAKRRHRLGGVPVGDTSGLERLEQELASRLTPAEKDALARARRLIEDADPQERALVDAYRRTLIASLAGGEADLVALAVSTLDFLAPLRRAAEPVVAAASTARRSLDSGVSLGPVVIDLTAPSAAVPKMPLVGHLPIDGLSLAINAGSLQASGTGFLDRGTAGGLLSADLGAVKVVVAALLGDDDGALGLLALLRADFLPAGIQLGLGFSLDSVGGMFGLNRGADVDAFRRALGDGSAMDALFGGAGRSATAMRATLSRLERLFPPSRGEVVVGPTARIGWLNVAGTSLVRLDVGVILVLPRGRVIVPGRAVVDVPGPGVSLVHLRADLLGDLDLAGRRLSLDAALVDSQVLGVFRIGGTGAAFLGWSDPPVVVMTLGGFFPGFDPRPALVPPQRRIALDLTAPLPGLQFSAEGYVAVTTGTLQLGGSLTAAYDYELAAVRGTVGGDALVQLAPLWFTATFAGKAAVEAFGEEVAEVRCTATVTGPGPLTLSVSASTTILWQDVGGTIDFVLSRSGGADRAPADTLAAALRRELRAVDNFTCEAGSDPLVRRATGLPPSTKTPLVDPVGALVWRQDQFPLDAPVTKADGRILPHPARVTVVAAGSDEKVWQRLTTSAFVDLADSAKLSAPAFERHEVGFRIPVTTEQSPTRTTQSSELQTVTVPVRSPVGSLVFLGHPVGLSTAMSRALGQPLLLTPRLPVATTVADDEWVLLDEAGTPSKAVPPPAAVATATVTPTRVAVPVGAVHTVAI